MLSKGRAGVVLLALAAIPPQLEAQDWVFDWNSRLSLGASVRTEARDPALVGKSNLDPSLCAADDCLATSPNAPEANNRYLAAPGAMASIADDGNLAYDRGDFINAPVKLTSRLKGRKGRYSFEVGGLAFYDFANAGFEVEHPNTIVAPGPQPGTVVRRERDRSTRGDVAYGVQLLDTYVQGSFEVFERPLDIAIGRQRLVWGESSFVTQGSLNVLNPPDVNNLTRPGSHFDEVYLPAGMLTFKGDLSDNLNAEAFWQFEWRPVGLPPRGSYFSFFNAGNEVTHNEVISLPFAKAPLDPEQLGTPANSVLALVSETSYSARRAPNIEPDNLGQYGVAAYWRPSWTEDSELGFYYARYHSRVPTASAYAADASCLRREGNSQGMDAANLVDLISVCGIPGLHQADAVPLDTARYFLEYPEGINLFGLSFSTLVGGVAVRGELAYRPNLPVQVDLEDVLFAAFQPALPRQDIPLIDVGGTLAGLLTAAQTPGNLVNLLLDAAGNLPTVINTLQTLLTNPNLLSTTVPGARTGIPDFVTAYRGGTPGEVAPGAYIRGYERMEVWQGSLGLTRIFGNSRFLGTSNAALLFELTGILVPDLPSLDQLQFEGPGTFTHAGPGAADTGNALHINPIRNTGGYVTEFSWGYRLGAILNYSDVFTRGFNVRPLLVFTHDVSGVSPGLGENFLEGRKLGVADVRLSYGRYEMSLAQTFFMGGGARNTLGDRDFFTASFTVNF